MTKYYELEQLGHHKDDILLMIHADDAGLSCSQNAATIEALKMGIVNSYSIMVPCPWFWDMANFAKNHLQYDCGIHLTLSCEWKSYKFGPVLPASEVPSLVDQYGYFHGSRETIKKLADPSEVKKRAESTDRTGSEGRNTTHAFGFAYVYPRFNQRAIKGV